MGDRALIQFKDKSGDFSPVVYLHWQGNSVGTLLEETMQLMKNRPGDVSYATARFIGICHTANVDSLSLGVWNKNELLTAADSHGDAGCFVVDVSESRWTVYMDGGYGLEDADMCTFDIRHGLDWPAGETSEPG